MGRIGGQNGADATGANRLGRIGRHTGLFAAGLIAGLSIGAFSGPEAPAVAAPPQAPVARVDANPEPISVVAVEDQERDQAGSVSKVLAEWLAMAESERLAAMASKITGAGLDFVAESVIERLEDDALASLIASTTDFSAAELGEIEDVQGFAMGLARIAMEGTVREADEPDDSVRPIDFSEEITWDHRAAFTQSQFAGDTPRIYAVFESGALGLTQTLAKWTRVDDGEILLFERHGIRPVAESSYVYLDAPPKGFAPGEYRVDFYSADTELRWLASGVHRVSG